MSLLPEVREAILASAEGHAAGGRSWPRHSRWGSAVSTAAVIAIPLVIVVVVAAVLFNVHHASHPTAGFSAPRSANPEAPLLRTLRVLRRPQTKADLPPALVRGLRRTGAGAGVGPADLAGVRLATVTPAGQRVFLVPYKPPRKPQFHDGLRIEAPVDDTLEVAVVYQGTLQEEFGGGVTARSITDSGDVGVNGEAGNSSQLILVAPDGVAKVTLLIPLSHRHGPTTTKRITRRVHNNVIVTQVPEKAGTAPPTMIWYGSTGRVVRRLGPPTH